MNELKKYRSRLVKEGLLKSALYAAAIAFAALAISAVIFWFVDFKAVWLGAVIFAAFLLIALPVIYFAAFRPTQKAIAKRLDSEFGLDDRMLTMLELENCDTLIANKQRENTLAALKGAGNKKIAIVAASVAGVVGLAVTFVFGAGMTTVSALSANDVIPSGKEVFFGGNDEATTYTITYKIQGMGKIEGKLEQVVGAGQSASSVWAIPASGEDGDWVFTGWSDGYGNPYRVDKDITSDVTLVANFVLLSEELEEDESESDESDSQPPVLIGNNSDISEWTRDPNAVDESSDPSNNEGENAMNGKGGEYVPTNQVIDGETYYGGSTYENARQQAGEEVSESDGISDDLKDIIDGYYDIIKK